MMKGAVLFAFNTDEVNYFKQAEVAAKRINHFLDLPVTVITNLDSMSENADNVFDKIIFTKEDSSNTLRKKTWINKNRYEAFESSPYDQTLLLDTDYVINSNKLLKTFDLPTDICAHKSVLYLMNGMVTTQNLSEQSFETFWATVVNFKKTKKVKQIFESMKMIQENYLHYSSLHNFVSHPYRNDYALTLAKRLANGHFENENETIPWALVHIGEHTFVNKNNTDFYDTEYTVIFDTTYRGKFKKEYITIKDMDFHMLNKKNFSELYLE
jgi:hypothetical protein